MPAVRDNTTPVNCPICDKPLASRKSNLDRHILTHYKDKGAFMYACPYDDCTYKTLHKYNLQSHIGKHTGAFSHRCPECPFATNHPSRLITHRKTFYGYKPAARRYLSGRAARVSAAAPYPSTQHQHQGVIPASMDLDPMVPDLAGPVPCDAAESSHSGNAEFLDEYGELTWEKLFPPEIFGSLDEQSSRLPIPIPAPTPTPTPNSLQPSTVAVDFTTMRTTQIDPRLLCDGDSQLPIPNPDSFEPSTVPFDLSTLHISHFDPMLLDDYNSQPPVPAFDGDLQWNPVSGNDLGDSLPAGLEEFFLSYGSGSS